MKRGGQAFNAQMAQLESKLGHSFARRELLAEAITHRSYAAEHPPAPHNERLEFLGDAVLGFILCAWLVEQFPSASEGELAKAKGHLAASAQLARAAERIGLGEALRIGRNEEQQGGRLKQTILENAFEAVVAALYLDGGIAVATQATRKIFAEDIAALDFARIAALDAKTALQDWLRLHRRPLPNYETVAVEGQSHQPTFYVTASIEGRLLGEGRGPSRKAAEQVAADMALARLKAEAEADVSR
ncbi:MAG: ribonuclease III [Chloracidobacterium sp. CP2_5A]|nr:MAG: ribonuclease III [Chloracidobacterium sp. CP2_5A]